MDQVPPPGWTVLHNALTRTFTRADFVDALAFTLAVGKLAEADNHHPDIDLRYNKVLLNLSTHSEGHKITAKDLLLAEKINGLSEADIRLVSDDVRRRFAA